MLLGEKERLLALFDDKRRWCQHAEARDDHGDAVRYDDGTAVAWDLTGALCLLFGWRRACELFPQLDRHISGKKKVFALRKNPDIDSMAALQQYNDLHETTYERIVGRLRTMPVWRGKSVSGGRSGARA
jgi:hypothetical protein